MLTMVRIARLSQRVRFGPFGYGSLHGVRGAVR
jgi:hypothetical protein